MLGGEETESFQRLRYHKAVWLLLGARGLQEAGNRPMVSAPHEEKHSVSETSSFLVPESASLLMGTGCDDAGGRS